MSPQGASHRASLRASIAPYPTERSSARSVACWCVRFVLGIAFGAVALLRLDAQGRPGVISAPGTSTAPEETSGHAVRALLAPVIDGRDDDPVWRTAPPMTQFRQFDPGEDQPTAFRTEVRAAYDDRYLYVVVRAFDPHPDSIVSLLSRRDVKTASDQLKIIIDAYHDRRTGVEMAINPAGVQRDYAIYSDNVEDGTWDGVWDGAARIDSAGWVAEFRVPFSQLRFTASDANTFGFGVWRDIARRNQRDAWPAYRMSKRTFMSQLGTLDGIDQVGAARRLELLPYVVTKSVPNADVVRGGTSGALTAGLDLKAGIGPNVTIDATVNPDFGQVEAAPAVLNLSAFEIQFAEQRPFFQEGANLYRCNGPCEGVFYTRRIGRVPQLRADAADATFTHIIGAAKVSGRFANGVAFGLLDASTERVLGVSGTTIEPQTNYLVGRLLQELRGGPRTVNDLADATGMAQANVSRHLAVLFASQLVSRERDGVYVHYSLADRDVLKLCELVCGRLESELLERRKVIGGR